MKVLEAMKSGYQLLKEKKVSSYMLDSEVLLSKTPINVRNSPTKLLVPGKPKLAIEKKKKNALNSGRTCATPV